MEDRKRKYREYRDILGVDESADEETVKKAYFRLAREYHPDRPNNKGKKEEADRMFHKVSIIDVQMSSISLNDSHRSKTLMTDSLLRPAR